MSDYPTRGVASSHDAGYDIEKKSASPVGAEYDGPKDDLHIRGLETNPETMLHRGLKARHITMIAIGGAIGTGLIVGTGKALAQAGPGSLFISYTFVGFIVYIVMTGLGEMATHIPLSSGFTGYASRYCDSSLGFALGYSYLFKYLVVTPNQLTAGALILQYWVPREKVNPGVFITVFLIIIVAINYLGIRFFGELEFWLSAFKVITIIGVILFSLIVACGGVDGDARGFRYWHTPGAFKPYIKTGAAGQFLGFWSTMVNAIFAYLGTELVGVTVAEAQNPRKTVPRAIKLTFYRILFFYCLSVLLVGMIVPWNSEDLVFANTQRTGAAASPFVVAAKEAGVDVLAHILNACILVFVLSASNTDLYIASRTLYALSSDGSAPAIFKRTDKRGVPIYALGFSVLFCLLAYLNVSGESAAIFSHFVNVTSIFGLLTWIMLLITHISWCRGRKAQGLGKDQFVYTAPFGIWGSYFALFFCILFALTKNYDVFVKPDTFVSSGKYKTFITAYIGIPVAIIAYVGHKFTYKTKALKPHEIDFYTGKDFVDREEQEFLAIKAARLEAQGANKNKGSWFYKTFIAWIL